MTHRYLILLVTLLFLVPAAAQTEPSDSPGFLRIGEDLTYQRGTAVAQDQLLKFPYRHSKNSKTKFWAFVVHQPNGSRLILKKDESEGKKDKSGDLLNQDFPPDHPFQKVLDQIKLDALLNTYKEVSEASSLEPEDWQALSHGAAVHKAFFKSSERRIYAIVGMHDPKTEKFSQPLLMTFVRTNQGPVASMVTVSGQIWGEPQFVDPSANLATHAVFTYVESQPGF